jgi:hypothetical protein
VSPWTRNRHQEEDSSSATKAICHTNALRQLHVCHAGDAFHGRATHAEVEMKKKQLGERNQGKCLNLAPDSHNMQYAMEAMMSCDHTDIPCGALSSGKVLWCLARETGEFCNKHACVSNNASF